MAADELVFFFCVSVGGRIYLCGFWRCGARRKVIFVRGSLSELECDNYVVVQRLRLAHPAMTNFMQWEIYVMGSLCAAAVVFSTRKAYFVGI